MKLEQSLALNFTFAEVCECGRNSAWLSCRQDGYRKDSVHVMASGRQIFYGVGKLDDYAVHVGEMCADGVFRCGWPSDKYYFDILRVLGERYGRDVVYADAMYLYNRAGLFRDVSGHVCLSPAVVQDILAMVRHYPADDDALWAEEAFCCVYYGMVAEENKRNAVLGATIKMNGICNVLKRGMPVIMAADSCRQKNAARIYDECVANRVFRDKW